MTTPATLRKRQDLITFIERVLAPEPALQAVIAIGSVAGGLARPDSDIDAVVFLDPFDWYIVPAESYWCPSDGSFHSIFSEEEVGEECVQLDFARLDLAEWADPSYDWPEERRAELCEGWMAFERSGEVAELIATHTTYTDATRRAKLDEAIVWLDQHLSGDGPQRRWDSVGALIAHDCLQAAYGYLVQALFATNRRWRPWRNREMQSLLALPWLPEGFGDRVLSALNAPSPDYPGYLARVDTLQGLFEDLVCRLIADCEYGEDAISEAFIRSHDEPGRAWNMEEWNRGHAARSRGRTRPWGPQYRHTGPRWVGEV
jgi:hypothetical protein